MFTARFTALMAAPCQLARAPWTIPLCAKRRNCTARKNFVSLRQPHAWCRSEEHTSELQSRSDLVCRLLLEKKKKSTFVIAISTLAPRARTALRSGVHRRCQSVHQVTE